MSDDITDPRRPPSYETFEEASQEVDRLLKDIRGKLVSTVAVQDLGLPSKLPFKLASMKELLLWRIRDLGEAASVSLIRESGVPGLTLVRSLMETVVILYDLKERALGVLDRQDLSGFDEAVMTMLFGGRVEGIPMDATNILTYVKRMDSAFEGPEDEKPIGFFYDHLCEFAHPNLPGLMGAYGSLDTQSQVLTMSLEGEGQWTRALGIDWLAFFLSLGLTFYDEIGECFEEFKEYCHEHARRELGETQ